MEVDAEFNNSIESTFCLVMSAFKSEIGERYSGAALLLAMPRLKIVRARRFGATSAVKSSL